MMTSFVQPKLNSEKTGPGLDGLDNEIQTFPEEGQLLNDGLNKSSVPKQEEKPENDLEL